MIGQGAGVVAALRPADDAGRGDDRGARLAFVPDRLPRKVPVALRIEHLPRA